MNVQFLLLITLISFCTKEQNNLKDTDLKEKVKINNWGKQVLIMNDNFWESAAKKMVPQYGQDAFLRIRNLANRSHVPCQMQLICEDIDGSARKNQDSLFTKLNQLVMYKIATFPYQHLDGKNYDYIIVQVPYDENKYWDATVKWDTLYFVFPANVVQNVP